MLLVSRYQVELVLAALPMEGVQTYIFMILSKPLHSVKILILETFGGRRASVADSINNLTKSFSAGMT